MDLSDRLSRTAGSFTLGAQPPNSNGSVGIPTLSGGTPWFHAIPLSNGGTNFMPILSIESTRVVYRTTQYTSAACRVVYGVF